MTWQFALTGLLVGTLVGLTGMGDGALLTPILAIGLTAGLAAFATWAVNAWLHRPRPLPARGFD